jgi:hypothetical protein
MKVRARRDAAIRRRVRVGSGVLKASKVGVLGDVPGTAVAGGGAACEGDKSAMPRGTGNKVLTKLH